MRKDPKERAQATAVPVKSALLPLVFFSIFGALFIDVIYYLFDTPLKISELFSFPAAVIALIALLSSIIIHEFVHYLGFKMMGAKETVFGIDKATLSPYARTKNPLPISAYRLVALLPFLILGVIPFFLGLILGSRILGLLATVQILGSLGDLYVLWKLRGLTGCSVLDHPTLMGAEVVDDAAL